MFWKPEWCVDWISCCDRSTTVDGAWNEIYKAREQVRRFTADGDTLSIRTGEGRSGVLPGKLTVGTLVWERED